MLRASYPIAFAYPSMSPRLWGLQRRLGIRPCGQRPQSGFGPFALQHEPPASAPSSGRPQASAGLGQLGRRALAGPPPYRPCFSQQASAGYPSSPTRRTLWYGACCTVRPSVACDTPHTPLALHSLVQRRLGFLSSATTEDFFSGRAKGVRGNLPPLRRPVLCWPNACPVRACAGPCENRRLHPFSEGALGHHDVVSPGAR